MSRVFLILGGIFGLLGVGAGAVAAHALRTSLVEESLAVFETAVRYQLVHAVALLFVGLASARWPDGWWLWAGWLFLAGVVLFSGSLYALALTGVRWPAAVTPAGGLAFLAGWVCLILAAVRLRVGGA